MRIGGRPVPARVVQTPFFDPEMARARSRPQDDQLRKPQPSSSSTAVTPRMGVAAVHNNGNV
ncbi:MAG: hypothetical protein IN808_06430 [Rubrobacter sp.]|nr:hypothetical protein [Rubrobacter sp.]